MFPRLFAAEITALCASILIRKESNKKKIQSVHTFAMGEILNLWKGVADYMHHKTRCIIKQPLLSQHNLVFSGAAEALVFYHH